MRIWSTEHHTQLIHSKLLYANRMTKDYIQFLNCKLNNLKGFKMKDNAIFNIEVFQGYI